MNLNENIAEDKNIDDKIKGRLLRYYLCWFAKKNKDTVSLVNYLFENRNDLPRHRELINSIGMGRHDQIAGFLKDCLKNGFSSFVTSKFVEIHKDLFFDSQGKEFIININGDGESYTVTTAQRDKGLAIYRFLLLILDISQDENFRSPKRELTIDYILELAKNIPDYRWRYRFKMAAISYFLPDDNEYIKSHLFSVMSDMKKLFAQELSDDNNEIKMECKFEIKYRILNMLTAKRNLIRKDIANFYMDKDSNFMCAFDPWASLRKVVDDNGTRKYKYVKYRPYAYYHNCLPDDVLRRQNNLLYGNFEDQDTQESFVIANDLSEIDNMPNLIQDDIENFEDPDDKINFIDDDADEIKALVLTLSNDDDSQRKKSAVLDNILDFAADYIKPLVDNKVSTFDLYTGFLFFDIRNLFSDKVLLQKIDELLKKNEHNQNDYKIFTLVLALLQNNNDGSHYLSSFVIAEQFANKTVLQKTLNTEMKFKLLNFVRKEYKYVQRDMFDKYYKELYKVLFSDGDIRWKIENRLLKFYKDKFQVKSESSSRLIDFLFDNRYYSADHQELIDAVYIDKHDQITQFVKNGLENNFSTQAISKFITSNESMFFNGIGQIYSAEINEQKLDVKFVGSKSSRIMRFLLLVLDISQDKNFRNPKQELTIDYIVELAKNIDDHKDRYKFKILALSYFLPDRNWWFDENKQLHEIDLSQSMIDIKKLFADEFSKENQDIDEKERLEIKRMAIDMLAANRDLIRKDASNLNLGDDSYLKKYCSCLKDGTKNFWYYHNMDSWKYDEEEVKFVDNVLDFFEDDIKKSINNKNANNSFFKSNGLLFSNIRRLFGERLLLQKIIELIKDNQNGKNDYKIFVLIFALIQDCNSPEFCIDKSINNPYGIFVYDGILERLRDNLSAEMKLKLLFFFYKQLVHVRKNNGKDEIYIDDKYFSERGKLVSIFYPDFEKYICDFCEHCKEDEFSKKKSFNITAFGSLAWRIFENNHDNVYNKHEVLKDMLNCVSDRILQGDQNINPFLYEFLGYMSIQYVDLIKRSKHFRNESVIIFDCFISLIEEDNNMSANAKKDINDFVITLFNPANLRHYLKNDRFVKCLARIIKNEKFKFDLPSQNKSFFDYIKSCLKSVTNNDNDNVLTRYKKQKNKKVSLENEIKNLSSRINNYKRFYWFNLVPVLGWVGCCVLYFSKVKSMENELDRLRTQLGDTESVISEMEKLGCKNIETFINSGDNYDKNKTNSNLEIANESDKKPLLNELGDVK